MGYTTDAITPGVGVAIAVDRVGGADYQLVKLMTGGVGVANEIALASPLIIMPGAQITEDCTRAAISINGSGDNTVIAADATHKIGIYAIMFSVDTPVSVKLGEGGPTYWTGAMKFGTGGSLVLTEQGKPYFLTSAINKAFLINLSAAVQLSGVVWYRLI